MAFETCKCLVLLPTLPTCLAVACFSFVWVRWLIDTILVDSTCTIIEVVILVVDITMIPRVIEKQMRPQCSESFDPRSGRGLTLLISTYYKPARLFCIIYRTVLKILDTSINMIFPCLLIWRKFFPGVST